MAYSIILTSSEITEINRLRRTEKEGKILRRYQCIWMANDNFPKKEIALTLGVNIDTVTNWIKIFNMGRMESLRILHYAGRRHSRLNINVAKLRVGEDAIIVNLRIKVLAQALILHPSMRKNTWYNLKNSVLAGVSWGHHSR